MLILLASSSWAPFLQTLVGAIFGALGAIAGGAFGTWFTWEKERQNLAAALAGEIHAINSLVEFRGFKEKLQSFICSSREAKKLSYHSRLVTQDYFVIFKRNADKIGHLPPDLARDVADFYVRAKGVIEDFKLLGNKKPEQWDLEHGIAELEELAMLLEELTKGAEILVPKLQAEAQRTWYALKIGGVEDRLRAAPHETPPKN